MAKDLGLFEMYGLNAQIVNIRGAAINTAALLAGEIQMTAAARAVSRCESQGKNRTVLTGTEEHGVDVSGGDFIDDSLLREVERKVSFHGRSVNRNSPVGHRRLDPGPRSERYGNGILGYRCATATSCNLSAS